LASAAAKGFTRVGAHASAQSPSFDTTPPRTIWSNPFGPGPEILSSTPSASSASASSTTALPDTILSSAIGISGPPPTTTITHTPAHTLAPIGFSTGVNPSRPAAPPGRPEQGLPPPICGSAFECVTGSSATNSASGGLRMGVGQGRAETLSVGRTVFRHARALEWSSPWTACM
ncbi:hypothetical protein FB107DRAFT_222436, partial [Schizophyllum commune]